MSGLWNGLDCRGKVNGEGRNRTGDTTIFSRGSGRAETSPDTTTETA